MYACVISDSQELSISVGERPQLNTKVAINSSLNNIRQHTKKMEGHFFFFFSA